MDLFLILLISVISVPLVYFTEGPLRIIFGLSLIFFFPGYTLTAALFPGKSSISNNERLAISFGLSIVVTPLIGFILNFTPWGLSLHPVLLSLILFIIVASSFAFYFRSKLVSQERYEPALYSPLRSFFGFLVHQNRRGKIASVGLVAAVLASIGVFGYTVIKNKEAGLTEFYLLGRDGKAENYPERAVLGRETQVTLGVVNKERETVRYTVAVINDNKTRTDLDEIVLNRGERWEKTVGVMPARVGSRQLEFLLFKNGLSEPYGSLHLLLDVTD